MKFILSIAAGGVLAIFATAALAWVGFKFASIIAVRLSPERAGVAYLLTELQKRGVPLDKVTGEMVGIAVREALDEATLFGHQRRDNKIFVEQLDWQAKKIAMLLNA